MSTAFMSVAFMSAAFSTGTASFATASLAASLFAGFGHASSDKANPTIAIPVTSLRIASPFVPSAELSCLDETQSFQKRIESLLPLEGSEEGIAEQIDQPRVLLADRFVEHIEGLGHLVPLRQDLRLLVEPIVALRPDELVV